VGKTHWFDENKAISQRWTFLNAMGQKWLKDIPFAVKSQGNSIEACLTCFMCLD